MTPALTTEMQGVDFALPPVRQDFPTNNAELRLRWLPVGTVSITLADFIAGVTLDAVAYNNPGKTDPVKFDTFNTFFLRVRPYDDLLPPSGSIVAILTDVLNIPPVSGSSLNSPPLASGSHMVLSQSTPFTALATSEVLLSAAAAVNLAVDLMILGHQGAGPA